MQKSEMMAKLNQVYQNLHGLKMPMSEQNVMLMADCYLTLNKLATGLQEQEPEQNREEEKAEGENDGEAESESD
jgi:hypothetical protein